MKKTSIYLICIAILIIFVTSAVYYLRKPKGTEYQTIIAKPMDLFQIVSITGSVKPSQEINLAMETAGRVTGVNAITGAMVKKGQTLVTVAVFDLMAQKRSAEASVKSAEAQLEQYRAVRLQQLAKLDELKAGPRAETIEAALLKIENTKRSLIDAETNLEGVRQKGATDVQKVYSDVIDNLRRTVLLGRGSLITFSVLQYAYFNKGTQQDFLLSEAKGRAVYSLLGEANAGNYSDSSLSILSGGIYALVQKISITSSTTEIENTLTRTIQAMEEVRYAYSVLPVNSTMTAIDITTLNNERNTTNTEISVLSQLQQGIATQNQINDNALRNAQANITERENMVKTAKQEYTVLMSGASSEQIAGQEAVVRQTEASIMAQKAVIVQMEANVHAIIAQLSKSILRSPVDGTVTKRDIEVGEIVLPNTHVLTIISNNNYRIEAHVAEADIAKLNLGDTAEVTLDAYGDDVIFEVSVTFIEPSETVVEGVATYKTTFEFKKKDDRVKSGMTANIEVITEKREQVIVLPARAIIDINNEKKVRIKNIEDVILQPITTGLRGSDGNVEILTGVKEGDEVVVGQ